MFKQAVFAKGHSPPPPFFLLSLVWLVALLLILVGNCILFTLLFSSTREPLSYSQQGYLYSVALWGLLPALLFFHLLGKKRIVHLGWECKQWLLLPAAEIRAIGRSPGCHLEQTWWFPKIWLRGVEVYHKVYWMGRCAQVWPGRVNWVVFTACHLVPP